MFYYSYRCVIMIILRLEGGIVEYLLVANETAYSKDI